AAQHPRVGFRAQLAEHRHVLDRDHAVDVAHQPERPQHAHRVPARRVGDDELAPGQPRERGAVVRARPHSLLEPGQPMRLFEEVRRADAVVAHQSEQRRAVAQPIALAQPPRLVGVDAEVQSDVLAHRDVQLAERSVAGVVQRVVEIEKPGEPGADDAARLGLRTAHPPASLPPCRPRAAGPEPTALGRRGAQVHHGLRAPGEHRRDAAPRSRDGIIGAGAMQRSRRLLLRWAAGFAALSGSFGRARSQTYPTRPIRLVIPFPPGGAYDAVGRPLAEKLTALLGTLVVENIGGAGASLGAAAVAHAQPDGYTLLLGGTLPHVNEALLKSRPLYDPVRDLAPIASVAVNSLCIAIHPSLPARTLNELIAYAKANPGKLSYGHAGLGSIQHLTGELFKVAAGGLDIVPVPYRGTGPLLADLVGGQVQMGTPGVTRQAIEFHRSGRLRILAVTSA